MPDGEIVEMETDEYLKGVVPAEMGYVFERSAEALRAQAVASRTYAAQTCLRETAGDPDVCERELDANVDTTTRTQVWRPVHYEVSDAAVDATHGQVVRHGGQLIPALFFARARLRTLDSEDSACCGGRSWPFLRSVSSPDPFAARRGHGAGMSQEGAATLADWGATADEIVAHYYTGTSVDPPEPTPAAEAGSAARGSTSPKAAPGSETGPGEVMVTSREPSRVHSGSVTLRAEDLSRAGPGDVSSSSGAVEGSAALVAAESAIIETRFPFMAVGAHWSGPTPDSGTVELAVRTSRDALVWSDWTRLEPDEGDEKEPPPAGEIWSRLLITRGRFMQLRVAAQGGSDSDPDGLDGEDAAAGEGDAGSGAPGAEPGAEYVTLHYLNSDAGPAAPTIRVFADDGSLVVIPRSGWGADESLRFDDDGSEIWPAEYTAPRAQIVHHTVTANAPADPAAVVRAVYHYHAVTREWGDIGYNFLVDHRGNIYEGRFGGERGDRITQGGHALQFNPNTIGVSVLGTYTAPDQQPTVPALDALVRILAHKGVRFGIEPFAPVTLVGSSFAHSVLGHRDVMPGHTVCPGDGLHARLPEVRTRVDRLMNELWQPAPPPTAVHSTATATRRAPTATRRPPTATLAPPPTYTPPPAEGCRDLVVDGGFEDGSGKWVRSRAHFTSWDAHSGDWAMFVGLRDTDPDDAPTYASVWQLLDAPVGVGQARLTFAARTRGFAGDRHIVRVLDENGAVVALGRETLPAMSDWAEHTHDLTEALSGADTQSLRIYFATVNDGDGRRSYMRVDDVSLVVCDAPASGTPSVNTPTPATPTPKPVPATATPSAPPTSSVRCGTLLRDGGFESPELGSWQLSGHHPAVRVHVPVHAGTGALRLGLDRGDEDHFGYAAAAQAVTFPDVIVSARMELWSRPVVTSREDALVVELRRLSDGLRHRLLGLHVPGVPGQWTHVEVDIDPDLLDGTMEFYVSVLNRGQSELAGGRTAVVLDGVRLEVCFEPTDAGRYVPLAVTAKP
jgi:hypothetical protein